MKELAYYDALPWDVGVERDIRADGSFYYVARHPEFGPISGSSAAIPFPSRRP